MPLLDVQRSLRQLGKVRMGEKKRSAGGKEYPSKLANWRLTSPAFELLEAVAQVYGGTVERWEGAPTEGEQYQCYTETDRLRVIVPPGDNALQQWHETWSAGGCAKRCDGVTEQLGNAPCSCPADIEQRAALAAKGKACKMTTRLKVILPDIPDIGVWMLESHGYYAAVELAGTEELLQMAAARGTMIPAQLRIDQRTAKRGGETRRFAVPVLELISVTTNMLMTGEVTPALGTTVPSALGGSTHVRALDAPRVAPRSDAPERRAVSSDGPPMPPLPGEEPDVGPVGVEGVSVGEVCPPAEPADAPSAARPVNRVAIACREAEMDDDDRHDLCSWASLGRVSSSSLLTVAEQSLAIYAAGRVKAGTARLVNEAGEGASAPEWVLRDVRFGWPMVTPTADGVGEPIPLDELRVRLRERLEPLGDKGKAGWKEAGLPALSRLAEGQRELALETVWRLEGEPF